MFNGKSFIIMLGIEYKTGFNGRGKAGNESLVISNKD